jgi:hypothetical protein
MSRKKRASGPNDDIIALLQKSLVLQLFVMGVPQAQIGKKLKMDIHVVNDFLKGAKKNAQKTAKKI